MRKFSHFHRVLFIVFTFIGFTQFNFAQENSIPKPPPKRENTYLFSIHKYNRQPQPSAQMKSRIAQILVNPTSKWTADDSLYFAYESVYLRKFGLALNIFARLNTDTIKNHIGQILYRVTLKKTHRYKRLLQFNEQTLPNNNKSYYTLKDAFNALTNAYILQRKGKFTDSTVIFSILKDSSWINYNKNLPPYKNNFSVVSYAIDSALRQFTILEKKRDNVLAQAFKEMAVFQEKYLYLTNAFFYYSASLYYDRNNSFVINERNRVIDAMTAKNYLSIKFNTLFGKMVKNRYDFSDNYMKNVSKDTIIRNYNIPQPQSKNNDLLPGIPAGLLYIIGMAFILLLMLLFVRTKKKK